MNKNDTFRPVKVFGFCLLLMGITIILMHFSSPEREQFSAEFRYFALIVSSIHFFIGLGVILKKKWGYYCFKFYLYILSIGFPIGTFIGLKMLKYINQHDVKKFFDSEA